MNWLSKLGDWGDALSPYISSAAFDMLIEQVKADKAKGVFPHPENLFKAFETTQLEDLKVVILGQDPYHNGQATGLAFGVESKTKIPPSLKIIRRELQAQFDHVPDEFDHSLEHWAKQGVLLLNTALTVVKGQAGSHSHLWAQLTPMFIKEMCSRKKDIIFVLWGKHAQGYEKYIHNTSRILKSPHPAAEAYSGGKAGFFGNGHFLKVNELLDTPINWFELPKRVSDEEQIKMYE